MRRWIASEIPLFPHSKRAAAHHYSDRANAREEKFPPCRLRREKASCPQTQPGWLSLRCPAESRGLANPRLGATRVILPRAAAKYIAAPSTLARTPDPRRCWCNAASSRSRLETSGSHEFAGRRKDRTSAAFPSARESNRPLPLRWRRHARSPDGYETARVRQ